MLTPEIDAALKVLREREARYKDLRDQAWRLHNELEVLFQSIVDARVEVRRVTSIGGWRQAV